MYAPGPFTVVARDDAGDPIQWCGHWHDNGDEADECGWEPTTEDPLYLYIVHQNDFDPSACTPCTHELHPGECLRCLSLTCIHLNDTQDCERCYEYQRILHPPATDTHVGNSDGATPVEEFGGA